MILLSINCCTVFFTNLGHFARLLVSIHSYFRRQSIFASMVKIGEKVLRESTQRVETCVSPNIK